MLKRGASYLAQGSRMVPALSAGSPPYLRGERRYCRRAESRKLHKGIVICSFISFTERARASARRKLLRFRGNIARSRAPAPCRIADGGDGKRARTKMHSAIVRDANNAERAERSIVHRRRRCKLNTEIDAGENGAAFLRGGFYVSGPRGRSSRIAFPTRHP